MSDFARLIGPHHGGGRMDYDGSDVELQMSRLYAFQLGGVGYGDDER
jgi:hypothetical protein